MNFKCGGRSVTRPLCTSTADAERCDLSLDPPLLSHCHLLYHFPPDPCLKMDRCCSSRGSGVVWLYSLRNCLPRVVVCLTAGQFEMLWLHAFFAFSPRLTSEFVSFSLISISSMSPREVRATTRDVYYIIISHLSWWINSLSVARKYRGSNSNNYNTKRCRERESGIVLISMKTRE